MQFQSIDKLSSVREEDQTDQEDNLVLIYGDQKKSKSKLSKTLLNKDSEGEESNAWNNKSMMRLKTRLV